MLLPSGAEGETAIVRVTVLEPPDPILPLIVHTTGAPAQLPPVNHQHRHTGIGLMTPAAVHQGDAPRITAQRALTLQRAFDQNPSRFKGRTPKPPLLPDVVYINPPLPKEPDTQTSIVENPH